MIKVPSDAQVAEEKRRDAAIVAEVERAKAAAERAEAERQQQGRKSGTGGGQGA